jgi:hypothetical protein
LLIAGAFSVLVLVTGVHAILSKRHVDGAVTPTARAATAPRAAPILADSAAASAPFDALLPEGSGLIALAATAPSAEPIGADVDEEEQATVTKTSASADSVFHPGPIPPALEQDFLRKSFVKDPLSGNYMGPRLSAKTLREPLVPVPIDGKNAKDLRGHTVFLRLTIRDKLLAADTAMFKSKGKHLQVNYGFRSNALQYELYQQINGHGKVAQAGMSFHETGMAIDLENWRDAQRYMIEAGFVGGCYGIEEDLVHYSIDEITKSSNFEAFKRCTLKEIPKDILKGIGKVGGAITSHLPGHKQDQ